MARVGKKQSRAVLAFMFMPQIGRSLGVFGHIVPVFIRTLAIIFMQAGLLPVNHPATRYGDPSVRKIGFFGLMSEAWYTLRFKPDATVYQWGLFAAVGLMVAATVGTVMILILTVGLGVGAAAHAQLFGLAGRDTSMDTMPAAPAGTMFDKTYAGPGGYGAGSGHDDYGIMILNKMLRQGMMGQGGSLQSAMQSLMQTYNTGILIIATLVLAWVLFSIVLDTARTGQFGGGRHNMVWAPIRIIFALSLIVPLGATGFSSGQFMVVKVAEWGSNLGSNMWEDYFSANIQEAFLLSSPGIIQNPTELVQSYMHLFLCKVSYNALTVEATGTSGPPPDEQRVRVIGDMAGGVPGQPQYKWAFTNETTGNLCGTVNLHRVEEEAASRILVEEGESPRNRMDFRIMEMRMNIANTYTFLFGPPTNAAGGLEQPALDFACAFAAQHIYEDSDGINPLIESGECAMGGGTFPQGNIASCGATPPVSGGSGGEYPNMTCPTQMINTVGSQIQAVVQNSFAPISAALNETLLTDADRLGWPGMGIFFLKLGSANREMDQASYTPTVTITPGTWVKGQVQQSMSSGTSGYGQYYGSGMDAKLLEISDQYEHWWSYQGMQLPAVMVPKDQAYAAATGGGGGSATTRVPSPTAPKKSGAKSFAKNLGDAENMDTNSVGDMICDFVFDTKNDPFMYDILEPDDPQVYPYSELAATGSQMLLLGGVIIAMPSVLALIGAAVPFVGAAGAALAASPIGDMFNMLGTVLITAGAMLTFYIPFLPFLRVAFATLTWMVSVFEAVMMTPFAGLAHLSTEGEGLSGSARQVWILWLNVLLRPALTVVGFVGAIMVFNSFIVFFHHGFARAAATNLNMTGCTGVINSIVVTIIYVFTIYTVANTAFKIMETLPNALMRWMGGSPDMNFQDNSVQAALGRYGADMMGQMAGSVGGVGKKRAEMMKDLQKRTEAEAKEKRTSDFMTSTSNRLGWLEAQGSGGTGSSGSSGMSPTSMPTGDMMNSPLPSSLGTSIGTSSKSSGSPLTQSTSTFGSSLSNSPLPPGGGTKIT